MENVVYWDILSLGEFIFFKAQIVGFGLSDSEMRA